MRAKSILGIVATFAFFWLSTNPDQAGAQPAWPSKPIRLVVAGAAGSGTDITARLFTEPLAKILGQQFVLDNRAGANGMIATEVAAKLPPDGYNFLITYAAAHVVNPSLYEKVPYDAIRDFAPVAQIGSGGNLLVVPPSTPANNLREFIAYVKSKPDDTLAYGSWGNGSGGHLSMEALNQQAGLRIRHVPYKSTTAANTDLLAGEIQVAFTAVASGLQFVQQGKLKALAVSGPTRVPQLPEVATMTEQGIPFDLAAWYGVFAPAGTPAATVRRLNEEINRLIAAPEMQERIKTVGLSEMPIKTPEQFAETVRSDLKQWGDIVRKSGIKAE